MTSRTIEILPPTAQFPATNWFIQDTKQAVWTAEENKRFEKALAFYDDNPDRWLKIAAAIPGKTVADVIIHYKELENDVSDIEAGLIPIPGYAACDDHDGGFALQDWRFDGGDYVVGGKRYSPAVASKHFAPPEKERKKGIPWTEEEHRRFLMGLKKYGKGDWRNISRNFVTTRTPTQVASHAQKYFIRQLSGGKDKRRSSIHDITTVNVPDHNHDLEPSDSFASSATTTALSSSSFHQTFLRQKAGHGFAFASSFGSYDAFQTWN